MSGMGKTACVRVNSVARSARGTSVRSQDHKVDEAFSFIGIRDRQKTARAIEIQCF